MKHGILLKLSLSLALINLQIFNCVGQKNLEQFITAGITNNPILKDINNQMLSKSMDSSLIRSAFHPQVNLFSQAMYAPVFKNGGYDSAITNGGNYSGLISISQPLFIRPFKSTQIKDVGIAVQSLINSLAQSENELRQGITSQFLSAYGVLTQLNFNLRLLQMLQEEAPVLKSLVEQGVYLQTDYLNLQAGITAQKIATRQLHNSYRNELMILNSICGIHDTSEVELLQPKLSLPVSDEYTTLPAFLKFGIDSISIVNTKAMQNLNYRPRVTAFGDGGFNSINPTNIPDNFGASVGLNLVIPIYDGGKRKLSIQKLAFIEESRKHYRDYYLNQHSQEYERILSQLNYTENILNDIKDEIRQQEQIISLYKSEIETGLVRFMDYLTVLNNYSMAKNNLTLADNERLQLINQLNHLK